MKIIRKIKHLADRVYKQTIACEQYPMLTLVDRKKRQAEGAIGLVYMLHHITEKDSKRIPTNEDLKVSPEFLEKIILKYKAKGFDFISLDQLNEIIKSDVIPERPFVTFTIDDGYLDNFTKALPVFERQQIPFAIFVATDFIDKKAILWWDSIEDLIMSHKGIVTSDGKRYSCESYQERWNTFRYLRERILNLDQNNLEHELKEMFLDYEIDWNEPIRKKCMSWEHVILLAQHPLCTIGGHTISHPALSKLSMDEALHEISEGKKRIEQKISQPISFFAYPYGTPNEVGEREFLLTEKLGLDIAFCAHGGCITKDNKSKCYQLPRVYFHEY
jgi:peptidoglycan/xylan/chitin deacetylase (PgdA/CDA1 family)